MNRMEEVTLTNMCMIYDDNHNILVQNKIDPSYCGITFPGGHVEKKEAFTDAIIREVFEETGLSIRDPKLCGIYNWIKDDGTRYIVLLYKTKKFTGAIKSSEEGEMSWIPLEVLRTIELADGMKEVLRICWDADLKEAFLYQENDEWKEKLF